MDDVDTLLAEAEQHILMADSLSKPGVPIGAQQTHLLRADLALTKARLAVLREETSRTRRE